jgi:UTP-glucose-1-phosphate uridylyltransferase
MIMKTSLVIMAAGIGSRFGGGIKQLEPVGAHNEIIMDFSIHDAIEAGFNDIIFIIRKDIEEAFKEAIGNRIENICRNHGVTTRYAFQALDALPEGISCPEGRSKPWGTGQAVLACKDLIDCPFVVINADDYYGKEAFVKIHDFLISDHKENEYCMAGFILKNTLSDNGGVTRGICRVENGKLKDVVETHDIIKTKTGASSHGADIDVNSHVSMNMWGLTPAFMDLLEEGFKSFFNALEDPLKGEYLIPVYIGELLRDNKVTVDVLETKDKWFGVTYKEDKETVVNSFKQLYNNGVYNEDLFSDL